MELNSGGSSQCYNDAQQQQPSSTSAAASNYCAPQHSYSPPPTQQSQNPKPNKSILFENPSLQFEPSSNIDPYAAVISHNNTHIGEGNAAQSTSMAYNQQPTQTGVYSAAGLTPPNGMEQIMPADLNPDSMTTASMVQPPTKRSTNKEPMEIKIVQSAWCEICKIACTSKDVLDIHKARKKHKKNLKKLEEPTKPSPDATSTNSIIGTQENPNPSSSSVEVQQTTKRPASSSSASADDIETKRRKLIEVGTNSIIGTQENPNPSSSSVEVQQTTKRPASSSASANDIETKRRKLIEVGTNSIIGTQENPNPSSSSVEVQQTNKRPASSSAASAEYIETKRRKLIEVGVMSDSVRVCTICNVVVNSETVFSYHLVGQKHASMVKRQANGTATAAAATGPEMVSVA